MQSTRCPRLPLERRSHRHTLSVAEARSEAGRTRPNRLGASTVGSACGADALPGEGQLRPTLGSSPHLTFLVDAQSLHQDTSHNSHISSACELQRRPRGRYGDGQRLPSHARVQSRDASRLPPAKRLLPPCGQAREPRPAWVRASESCRRARQLPLRGHRSPTRVFSPSQSHQSTQMNWAQGSSYLRRGRHLPAPLSTKKKTCCHNGGRATSDDTSGHRASGA